MDFSLALKGLLHSIRDDFPPSLQDKCSCCISFCFNAIFICVRWIAIMPKQSPANFLLFALSHVSCGVEFLPQDCTSILLELEQKKNLSLTLYAFHNHSTSNPASRVNKQIGKGLWVLLFQLPKSQKKKKPRLCKEKMHNDPRFSM